MTSVVNIEPPRRESAYDVISHVVSSAIIPIEISAKKTDKRLSVSSRQNVVCVDST